MSNENNIIPFTRAKKFDISYVIIFIVVLYVAYHIFSYATSKDITAYEVTIGTITVDSSYQALAIREETVIGAAAAGDIYYYVSNLEQVGVRTKVYSIDTTGSITEKLSNISNRLSVLSEADLSALSSSISDFIYEFDSDNFSSVSTFKTEISSELQQYYNEIILAEYAEEIATAQSGGSFTYYNAPEVGTIVFSLDGMEDLTVTSFSADDFDQGSYSLTNLKVNTTVTAGQSIYKLITSDIWYLVMEIDSDFADELIADDTNYIEIEFLEDGVTTWTSCSIEEKSGKIYLILKLDDGVSRYATSRYINISLLFDEETGLKIPNSAIVEKEFFTIPKAYFYKGGDSSSSGVLVMGEDGATDVVAPTIYYETDDYYYVDSEDIDDGATLLKPNSQATYTVGSETDTLLGVYNINKGYAVFKQIEIIYQNADYAIVSIGTSYGLANYDHIALDGTSISENELIN